MGKIIAFMNNKGGVGKTTSVVECAYHVINGSMDKRCLVVDLDPQANATHMLTGKEFTQGIFDCIVSGTSPETVVQAALEKWPNVACLPADIRLETIENFLLSKLNRELLLKKVLDPYKDMFDMILIDLPPRINIISVNALVASDGYVIPTDTSKYSESGIKAVKELADAIIKSGNNKYLEFIGILLTSFQKESSLSVSAFIKNLNEIYEGKVLPHRIRDSVKVLESQCKKLPVGSLDKDCSVSVAYRELTNFMLGV